MTTTEDHPFWVVDEDWVELQVRSLLQRDQGLATAVEGIQKREGSFLVYNLDIDRVDTFFVATLGILVHNCIGPGSSLPAVPTPTSSSPISMDEALDLSEQFLIPGVPERLTQSGSGIQVIQTTTNSSGQSVVRRVGFDVNPSSAHVRRFGPHLNLQTQVDGVIQGGALADPHIPIDPSTVRPGDF